MIFNILLAFSIHSANVLKIGEFLHINSLVRQNNRLLVSTPGGIYTYNLFDNRMERSVLTETPVKFAVMQNLLSVFFIDVFGNLYRWTTTSEDVTFLASAGPATSLGICCDKIYVENNGEIIAFTTSGFRLGNRKPESGTVWVGRLNSLTRDSLKVAFLAPFFFYDPLAGKVNFTYFYRDFNTLWVGTDKKGIYRYDFNLKIVRDSIQIGLPFSEVNCITGISGKIFIAGNGGIALKNGRFWSFIRTDCPDVEMISPLDSSLYFSSRCGIFVLKNRWIRKFLDNGKLLGVFDGLLFVQMSGRLLEVTPAGNVLSRLKIPLEISKMVIYEDSPLFLMDGKIYSRELQPQRKYNKFAPIYSAAVSGGRLYVLSDIGILEFKNGIVDKLPVPFKPSRGFDYPMVVADDKIFIGAPDGLYILNLKDLGFERYTPGFSLPVIKSLYFDGRNLYAGTKRGVIIFSFLQ